ncbi:alpha/beta hydrolase [Pedobacter miscanthi]|uniref:Alpha/beta hydrolase n=1 Tax=Pedobacter miscanthi TaxID=2259170 RepID=A0A366LD93_9SPHI|nr:alpha/beta hydrolase [Pedobacter miscanthi]RBQ11858.1 alpha/beta hydrolase [Pedobacter miscanthi]
MKSQNEQTATFANQNGQHIFYRNWNSPSQLKGIIVIIHGLNSHSAYYEDFASQLNGEGFEVYAMDLIGRGRSEGERYYIPDFHGVLSDIDTLINIVVSRHPSIPVFLLGHSAGGVFSSAYAVENQHKLQGLISESFAFKIPAPAFALAAIKLLARFIPHVRLVKLKNEDFSRDAAHVLKMNNDPLLSHEKQPAKTMQQLLLASEYLKEEMSLIKLPLLILHGTADGATSPSGSEYFEKHASSSNKLLKLYVGHYHDLLNDKYNGLVTRDIIHWLNDAI